MNAAQTLENLSRDLLLQAGWTLRAIFTCNHLRTPVKEGKCFCPDCGRGVVFQWVLLRCAHCNTRRDSRYHLRQILPAAACCAQCGEADVRWEYLDMSATGSYYQAHKARVFVQEADEYLRQRFCWSETASRFNDTLQQTLRKTRIWLDPSTPGKAWQPVLIAAGK